MASKSVLVRTNERPNNRLECPICKERFWLRCKYDDHVATHEHSRVSCNICSKSFYDQKLLDEHYLTHTNVIKTYNCKECARKFLQKYQLEQHMQFHKSPVDCMPFIINKRKNAHFNKVAHIKNIIDEISNSEEFHTSDSEDEEECDISDLEDYLPANKLVQTRSGRVVKRKKLFDEEETEIKHKSPKTEQVYTRRSITKEYKHQKNESPKISYLDAAQKSFKLKQVYAKKSTVSEYNNQKKQSAITDYNSPKKQSSKFSEIDLVRKNIGKELSVVVEKLPDHMFAKYLKKGNVFTENQANFSSTQESSKSFASIIAKQPNSSVTSVSINSITGEKSNSCEGKPRQLNFENVQKSPKVMAPNLTNKPQNSTIGDSIIDKRSEATESSKFTSKNIVNNSPSCSKTVGKSSSRNSGTDNFNKSILSNLSQVSPYKSSTCKEYVYVGSNPDFRKIKQAIEELSTVSNETPVQSKRVLNSLNSNISSKNNLQLSSNALLTDKSKKSGLKNPASPTNSQNSNSSQNVNQLNGNISEEGILEEKIIGECRVVKVTPEYMKKIQRDLLSQSTVPSTPNLRSHGKQSSETVAASHLNSDLNKSSAVNANNHAIIKENGKSNTAANMSVKSNTINNVTKNCQGSSTDTPVINSCSKPPKVITLPNKQLREFAFSNSNESLTLFTEKHLASKLNKNTTTPAKPSVTIREIQKSNVVADTSVETNLPSSMEIPTVGFSSTLEHAKVSGKHLASNLSESVTDCVEGLESQKSNAVANTSIEINNNVTKTCQRSPVETPIVHPSSSLVEHSKVLPVQCFQLPSNQMTWSTCANASPTVTNSNSPFLTGKQGTVNENQVSITSVKPYKVNNSKQAYQNNLVQTKVVYPIYLLHTSTPIMQSPNASLLHSEIPSVQSPNVSSVHTEIPTVQSPNVTLVHTQIPNIQSSDISLVHSEVPAEENLVFTKVQTIQSPTSSVKHSKTQAQQTTKLPIKKNETPRKALHVNRNLTLSKRKQITKKSVFQEPYCFTETSSELNKNLKTYQKVAVENTQKLPQSNLNELQTENIVENSIPECVHELIAEIDESIKSNNGSCEDNVMEDAVSNNLTLPKTKTITKKSLLEDPYTFTTDTSFEFNNNNLKTHQKVADEDTQKLSQSLLNKLLTENIADNSVLESEQEKNLKTHQKVAVEDTQKLSQSLLNKLLTENIADNSVLESEQEHQNELNDSMKSVNDNFIEDAVNSHVNNSLNVYPSNLIEAILVSHSEEDENKQTSAQTTLNESQTQNIRMEGFDNSQANPVKSTQQKNHCNDELHKDKNENEVAILPEVNRDIAVVDENKEITKESNEFTPVIVNSFTIDDDSFEKCQLNFFERTAVAPHKNIQVTQQSNMNDLLAVKPTDNSRTKSIGSEIKKRLRSHANKCESNQIDTAITTPNKNKQVSLKRTPASSSRTVKKQKVAQKYPEIDEKKSYGIKNPSDLLSNVNLNKNNKSKKASSKNTPDNKSRKNNESNKVSPKSNPDNKLPKNNESKEALPKSNPENKSRKKNESKAVSSKNNPGKKLPKNSESKKTSSKTNPDNNSPKEKESKEAQSKSNPDNKSPKKNENKEVQSKSSPDNKSPIKIPEKLLQRYQAKLEEKERKKKEKYELKKQIKYIQRYLSSPSRDSNEEDFSKRMFPSTSISVNDIAKICGKYATETNKQACVSQEMGTISTMPNNLKDSTDSSFSDIGKDSQNESESSKHFEETRAIAKARSITLKFNKDLNENESLQLLDELDELIDTYTIGDKCPFLDKTIRFCCLFVDSYKVRQKAISLRTKLKNMKSS